MARPHRSDWLYEAKWGVMFHYVYGSAHMDVSGPAEWNDVVNRFDVEGLADQLSSAGAGWLLLTISQHPPLNAPSDIFDRNVPAPKPVTTDRDLFLDAAEALEKRDISLMAYSTYFAPAQMFQDEEKDARTPYPDWWPEGLADYSRRWGPRVRGWWFDGQRGNEDLNRRLAEAARAGNPDAIVAFNRPHGFQRNSIHEDFTAGDTPHAPDGLCTGRWAAAPLAEAGGGQGLRRGGGLQWHMLSFLGYSWGPSVKRVDNPRYSAEQVAGISRKIVSAGGVVTWDVPPQASGLIHDAFLAQLSAVGAAVDGCRARVRI